MRQVERGFQAAIFFPAGCWRRSLSAWCFACCLLIYRFFGDFYELAVRLPTLTWHDLIVGVLNMIDIVLTANLVLIVIFSGYENFIQQD